MMQSSRPARALSQLIRYYYQVNAPDLGAAVLQPVPARSPQAIEFTFGTPYEVCRLDRGSSRNAYAVALIGAQTYRRVELAMRGTVDAFTIVFQPGGLGRLFSLPVAALTDDDVDAEAVMGRRIGELHRRMGEVSSFADRVRIADSFLCGTRPADDRPTSMAQAASAVLKSSGCIRVDELSRSCGVGIRQLERRFRSEIGVLPKLYARIVRFEAALRRKAAMPATSWTDIAHGLGYHDQMHMVHDFNRLSGDNPTAVCGRLDMFVRPELNSARESQLAIVNEATWKSSVSTAPVQGDSAETC